MRPLTCSILSIHSLLQYRLTWDLVLLLTASLIVSASSTCAPKSAAADPPPEEQLVIPLRVFLQCEEDARRVDRLEPALRSCQRDLDAQAGALQEARAQRAAIEEQRHVLERRVVELEAEDKARWSPLTWASIGAGSALVVVLTVVLSAR
jgi:hypothetical protein